MVSVILRRLVIEFQRFLAVVGSEINAVIIGMASRAVRRCKHPREIPLGFIVNGYGGGNVQTGDNRAREIHLQRILQHPDRLTGGFSCQVSKVIAVVELAEAIAIMVANKDVTLLFRNLDPYTSAHTR